MPNKTDTTSVLLLDFAKDFLELKRMLTVSSLGVSWLFYYLQAYVIKGNIQNHENT